MNHFFLSCVKNPHSSTPRLSICLVPGDEKHNAGSNRNSSELCKGFPKLLGLVRARLEKLGNDCNSSHVEECPSCEG